MTDLFLRILDRSERALRVLWVALLTIFVIIHLIGALI